MSAYQKEKKAAHQKKDVDIPGNKFVNMPFKNNNQSLVPVNVTQKNASKKFLNSSTVNDQVLTKNKNVGILNKKILVYQKEKILNHHSLSTFISKNYPRNPLIVQKLKIGF